MTMKQRFLATTPAFWKKVQKVGIALTTISTTLLSTPPVPEDVKNVAKYVLTAGLVITLMSQLTVESHDNKTV